MTMDMLTLLRSYFNNRVYASTCVVTVLVKVLNVNQMLSSLIELVTNLLQQFNSLLNMRVTSKFQVKGLIIMCLILKFFSES